MHDFAIIPVIDLKGGMVVHAAGGKRADYRPLETPLGLADDAPALARALIALTGADALYVADLDAIEGVGNHFELCRDLADSLPEATLWIDAGFSTVAECAFWLPLGATLVIGSESLEGMDAWEDIHASFGRSAVLSLDFEGDALRGPEKLLDAPSLWPERVIAMQLDRVGLGKGLDVERVKEIRRRNNACAIFAAGGVGDAGDLRRAAEAGAAGALIATALHQGAVTQKEIAALREERRP
jgi:phosphoribosylformimino-5-aminoimidazole carboxamide ribotide isomerase